MDNVAVLGPGLLGGSIALALKARSPGCRVALWARRASAVEEIRQAGVADEASTDLRPIVEGAQLVVFCVPVGAMPALAEAILPHIGPETLVTDVGSVKGPVVEALAPVFARRGRFLGSHPMAGSEQSGLAAARADLFEGATCILTPHDGAHPATREAVAAFWELLGCRIRELPPREHDETIGLVSHLPHLLAAVLVDFVHAENPRAVGFCGNGFRDTTRIASGPVPMWREILASNRGALSGMLERLIDRLRSVSDDFCAGNDASLESLLANAKEQRDRLGPKL